MYLKNDAKGLTSGAAVWKTANGDFSANRRVALLFWDEGKSRRFA